MKRSIKKSESEVIPDGKRSFPCHEQDNIQKKQKIEKSSSIRKKSVRDLNDSEQVHNIFDIITSNKEKADLLLNEKRTQLRDFRAKHEIVEMFEKQVGFIISVRPNSKSTLKGFEVKLEKNQIDFERVKVSEYQPVRRRKMKNDGEEEVENEEKKTKIEATLSLDPVDLLSKDKQKEEVEEISSVNMDFYLGTKNEPLTSTAAAAASTITNNTSVTMTGVNSHLNVGNGSTITSNDPSSQVNYTRGRSPRQIIKKDRCFSRSQSLNDEEHSKMIEFLNQIDNKQRKRLEKIYWDASDKNLSEETFIQKALRIASQQDDDQFSMFIYANSKILKVYDLFMQNY